MAAKEILLVFKVEQFFFSENKQLSWKKILQKSQG